MHSDSFFIRPDKCIVLYIAGGAAAADDDAVLLA